MKTFAKCVLALFLAFVGVACKVETQLLSVSALKGCILRNR